MPDKAQYLAWAAKARGQADDATTPAARALHLEIAADYEAKAAGAPDAGPEAAEEPASAATRRRTGRKPPASDSA